MNKDLAFLQTLVDEIETNLAEDVNIVQLAKKLGVSPWHFQRLFKSRVGDTLGGYIRGRRLSRAARLLLNSDRSIIDVAFSVGFNSHEAFTRSFKAYFSVTPKVFRQIRPSVVLNEKPLLSNDLIAHIDNEIEREPIIGYRPALTLVGYTTDMPSPFATEQSNCYRMQDAWMRLFAEQTRIPTRIPGVFYGLTLSASGEFTEATVTHLAAMAVADPDVEPPPGMVKRTVPEQRTASFEVATIDAETANRTMDYIYGYWLPNSGYRRGHGSDYEMMRNIDRFESPGRGSQYVIPLSSR